MTDYKKESQILSVLQFFQQNPGTAVSVSYVLLTFCGIVFSASFYHHFDVQILKMAEVSDLLVSGISEPAAMLMFLGGVLLAMGVDALNIRFFDINNRWRDKPNSLKKFLVLSVVYVPRKRATVLLWVVGMFILYSALFVVWYAKWKSQQIKLGDGDRITVGVGEDNTQREFSLLGSTTRYLIVYDTESEKATLINVEQIHSIQPVTSNAPDELKE